MASGMPGVSRSQTEMVASGVTSRGEKPVPPVVRMRLTGSMASHRDFKLIHTMWLVRPENGLKPTALAQLNEQVLKICRDFMQRQHLAGPSDIYDNTVVLFIQDTPLSSQMLAHAENLMACLEEEAFPVSFGFFTNQPDTSSVRKSFLLYQNHLKNARILYPASAFLSQAELSFTADCAETIARGEAMVRQVTAPIEPLLHTDSTIQEDRSEQRSAFCERHAGTHHPAS